MQERESRARTVPAFLIAAFAVWTLWCIGHLGPGLSSWSSAIGEWSGAIRSEGLHPVPLVLRLLSRATLLLSTLILVPIMLKAGLPPARLMKLSARDPDRLCAVGLLLGFILVGALYLAIALLGLFTRPVVYSVAGLALLVPTKLRIGSGWRNPGAGLFPRQYWWMLPAALPVAMTALMMGLPDTNGDAYCYHLASSERLLALHRLTAEGITIQLACSLTMEMIYSLPVGLGVDEAVHFVNCIPFGASLALLLSWCSGRAGGMAAAAAGIGILTLGQVNQLMLVAKNDLAAAAYPVAGMVCALDGLRSRRTSSFGLGALLLGCGVAVKYSCIPILLPGLLWIAASIRTRVTPGRTLLVLSSALIPVLPWFTKNWLMLADPAWPLLSNFLPGSLWDSQCGSAVRMVLDEFAPRHSLLRMPYVFVKVLLEHQPALAAIMPLALVLIPGSGKDVLWIATCSVAGIVSLWLVLPLEDMRYALPLLMLLVAAAAIALAQPMALLPRHARGCLLVAGVVSTWLPVGFLLETCLAPHKAYPYLTGKITRDDYLGARLTSYWSARTYLVSAGIDGKLINIGDERSFHMPNVLIGDRCYQRNWAWALSKESSDAGTIAKRMRQLGCRGLICNYFLEFQPDASSCNFVWDDRMVKVWRDFTSKFLALPPGFPGEADPENGGLYLYVVRNDPLPRSGKRLRYLPGLASLYEPVLASFGAGRHMEALTRSLQLRQRVPRVDFVDNLVARGYAETGQWTKALEHYRWVPEHGNSAGGPRARYVWGVKISMLGLLAGSGPQTKRSGPE